MGWDSREILAYEVAEFSIMRHASLPHLTKIIPLKLEDLPLLKRPLVKLENGNLWCPISEASVSTEFSNSRFMIPFLTKGWALFMDCDMVNQVDIKQLFDLRDDKYAVMVVKHKHESGDDMHMVDIPQLYYNRKNWSSVILWNCDHPANKKLTLEMVNTLPGRDLHRFCWLEEEEIGSLPVEWNYLVDVSPIGPTLHSDPEKTVKMFHFTLGGPWIKGWEPQDSDPWWEAEYKLYQNSNVFS